jgi:poly-gamma-glutamate capsule biosynthesis protein CapA/YwtB (metallophosphatase superfamily)
MNLIRAFVCGDVMTGRGIDQILPYPNDPRLHEDFVGSALDYVRLAEAADGPIPRAVAPAYIWGDALDALRRAAPDVRIVNLETSITRSDRYEPKGINYRMSPENVGCLPAAGIDCCVLANNHVLDWGVEGLVDTLAVLERNRIKTCGAGRNLAQAKAPVIHLVPGRGRILVFSFAAATSGTPASWAARADRPGVNFLPTLSEEVASEIGQDIERVRRPGDVVIVSIHWGPNWGYEVPDAHRRFAHALIDRANVSVVHGHSSHHPKGIEIYRNRLILYGCGDFLNDYEGIRGYEEFRDDLCLMYFADFDADSPGLVNLEMVAFQIRKFRLNVASDEDTEWLRATIERESGRFGVHLRRVSGNRITLSKTEAAL